MFQYSVFDGLYLQAGPQIGFLISAKEKSENFSLLDPNESSSDEQSIKEDLKFVDIGLNFGLGYKSKFGLNFDARYNLGLSDTFKENSGDAPKNQVIQLTLGYDIFKAK